MMRSLLKKRLTAQESRIETSESGITIVEIMVAIVIIAGILVFTATGLTTSSRTSVYAENRTKAQAYANDVLAIAQQSPYRKLFVPDQTPDENWGGGKCAVLNTTNTPGGKEAVVVKKGQGSTPFPGLVQCQAKQATNDKGPVGAIFYIQTQVYGITSAYGQTKEVWVTVRWKDVAVGPGQTYHYVRSVKTIAPTVKDCYITLVGKSSTTTLDSLNAGIPGCLP